VGKTLAEARLPQVLGARVLEIRREGVEERLIPLGETRLEAGDLLTLLGPTETLDRLGKGTLDLDEAVAHLGVD